VTNIIQAPFADEQVAALNTYQESGTFHPFTCAAEHGEETLLVATTDGWVCSKVGCTYTQNWAHAFMASTKS
jgi:hypothetical protein